MVLKVLVLKVLTVLTVLCTCNAAVAADRYALIVTGANGEDLRGAVGWRQTASVALTRSSGSTPRTSSRSSTRRRRARVHGRGRREVARRHPRA